LKVALLDERVARGGANGALMTDVTRFGLVAWADDEERGANDLTNGNRGSTIRAGVRQSTIETVVQRRTAIMKIQIPARCGGFEAFLLKRGASHCLRRPPGGGRAATTPALST